MMPLFYVISTEGVAVAEKSPAGVTRLRHCYYIFDLIRLNMLDKRCVIFILL